MDVGGGLKETRPPGCPPEENRILDDEDGVEGEDFFLEERKATVAGFLFNCLSMAIALLAQSLMLSGSGSCDATLIEMNGRILDLNSMKRSFSELADQIAISLNRW